jgi:hypothetical protein
MGIPSPMVSTLKLSREWMKVERSVNLLGRVDVKYKTEVGFIIGKSEYKL